MKYLFLALYLLLTLKLVFDGNAYANAQYALVALPPAPVVYEDPCRSIAPRSFDCTTSSTRELVYQYAKRSIKWYSAYDQLKTVKEKISYIADEKGFADKAYLLALSDCESKFRPDAVNSRGNSPAGSTDRGLFMFNDYWQKKIPDSCAFDLRCATEKTIELLKNGKSHLWACDKVIKRDGRIAKYQTELAQNN